jgi:serine/threonine protein kinase
VNNQLKLFDFGLSASIRSTSCSNDVYKLTGNTGTLRYMAPEVVLNRLYNQSVDVYSFGILLHQLVSQELPYKEMNKKQYVDEVVLGNKRLYIYKHWNHLLAELLEKCWHEDMKERPSFSEVVLLLEDLVKLEEDRLEYIESQCHVKIYRYLCKYIMQHRLVTLGSCLLLVLVGIAIVVSGLVVVGSVLAGIGSMSMHAVLTSLPYSDNSSVSKSSSSAWLEHPGSTTVTDSSSNSTIINRRSRQFRTRSLDMHVHNNIVTSTGGSTSSTSVKQSGDIEMNIVAFNPLQQQPI